MKATPENKTKLKNNNAPFSSNPTTSSSNRNIPDLKNSLIKNSPSSVIPPKQRSSQLVQPSLIQSEVKTAKPLNAIWPKEPARPNNPKPTARASVNHEPNIMPLVASKNAYYHAESMRNNPPQTRVSLVFKNPVEIQKIVVSPVNQSSVKFKDNNFRQNSQTDKHNQSNNLMDLKQAPVKRLSVNDVPLKDINKGVSTSKSFIDKDSLSLTQNSQNEPKKDSINFMREDNSKLTQRSYDPTYPHKKEEHFRNSFLVGNGEDGEQSKMSFEVLQSIKAILGDLKKSINDEKESDSDDNEQREILVLEEKLNRLRAKLISQGFRYMIKWVERKCRGRRREGWKQLRLRF